MSMEEFGKRILNLRQNANMTQEELARGNSPKYLPKLIENLENDLYTNPEISAEQLVERVCMRLSRLSYDVN